MALVFNAYSVLYLSVYWGMSAFLVSFSVFRSDWPVRTDYLVT